MISHSEAKTIWRTITNIQPTTDPHNLFEKVDKYLPYFPYRDTMRNSKDLPVVPAMVQINLYFKHLSPQNTAGYENVGNVWLKLVSYIPPERYSDVYRQLTQYFTQTKNYTPINSLSGNGMI